ncbi:MAG: hypothetical protein RLZZ543_2243 [Bacteroidota bacterium]|jgi:cytochrome c oxidase assembly protein subunit 15
MAKSSFLHRMFRPISRLTFLFTFLVILAGSVVRTTESGMGCPDWPKCFGYYIPPTDPSQVEFHANQPYTKGMMVIVNDTLWRATSSFTSKATFERSTWEKYPKHDYAEFYVQKTWIEYINRLLGAIMGIFVLGTVVSAFFQTHKKGLQIALGIGVLLFTGFQAWLGALVVASNLAPIKITVHMLAALLLLAVIQWMIEINSAEHRPYPRKTSDKLLLPLTLVALAFTIIQVLIGTQVREAVDTIANEFGHEQRELWIEQLPSSFLIHRAFSLLILALSTVIVMRAKKSGIPELSRLATLSGFIVLAEVAVGLSLALFDIPKAAQPLHLVLASMLFSAQFAILLLLSRKSHEGSAAISK